MFPRKTLACALALAISLGVAASASATTLNATVPLDGQTITACTDELLVLSGTVHVVGWTNPELDIFTKVHENNQGVTAVSTSGVTYTVVQNFETVLQPSLDSANVTHITLDEHFVSRDGSDNIVIREVLQIVNDANGNPRVFHVSGEASCFE